MKLILILVPVFLILYYIVPGRYKNVLLCLESLAICGVAGPEALVFLLISAFLNYYWGTVMRKVKPKGKRQVFFRTLVFNILFFLFFLYLKPLVGVLNPAKDLSRFVPLGLGFFTLNMISYQYDLLTGAAHQVNVWEFGIYAFFFPKMAAGPLMTFREMRPQLRARSVSVSGLGKGSILVIIGLTKLLVIAGSMYTAFEGLVKADEVTILGAWLGLFAFAFALYYGFAGYSDIARGMGYLFGFELPENVNYPYFRTSIRETVKRYHMSLMKWVDTYIGNPYFKRGMSPFLFLVTWTALGMLGGHKITYLLCGLYIGTLLLVERVLTGRILARLPKPAAAFITAVFVLAGLVIISSGSLSGTAEFFGYLVGKGAKGIAGRTVFYYLKSRWLIWVLALAGCAPIGRKLVKGTVKSGSWAFALIAAILAGIVLVFDFAFLVTQGMLIL